MRKGPWKYQRAMLKAIRGAAGDSSMTDGLRVINRFERVNRVSFNPFDRLHCDLVYNCGGYESFFRQAKKVLEVE